MKRYSAPSPLYPPAVVAKMLNKSTRTISNRVKNDPTFPKPIKNNGKTLGWELSAIEEWQQRN